jgi:hypothetical protein
MKIPPRVDAELQCVLHVAVVKPPRAVDTLDRLDRKNCRRAIGHAHASSGERHLHDESRMLACGMPLPLLRGGDAECGRVVVGAKRGGDEAATSRVDIARQRTAAIPVHDGAWSLDHDLHAKGALLEPESALHRPEVTGEIGDLFGDGYLRQRDDEIRGQRASSPGEDTLDEEIGRLQRARSHLARERLDANTECGRETTRSDRGGGRISASQNLGVFHRIRVRAVAILEVDSIVLDGLGLELLLHAPVHIVGERALPPAEHHGAGDRVSVRRKACERVERATSDR